MSKRGAPRTEAGETDGARLQVTLRISPGSMRNAEMVLGRRAIGSQLHLWEQHLWQLRVLQQPR